MECGVISLDLYSSDSGKEHFRGSAWIISRSA